MKINWLELKNFRNYSYERVAFTKNLNVIIGKNAQGKTNLLESIFLSSVGKSFKTSQDKELIKHGNERANIKINFEKNCGNVVINIKLENNKKYIELNQVNLLKISQLLGNLCCVFFSPNELKLVKETPEDRRKFINLDLSQINKQYYFNLIKYNNILKQRNKLLKMYENEKVISETLPIWNGQLVSVAADLILDRLNFVEKINKLAKAELAYLTNNQEELCVSYSSVDDFSGKSKSEIENILLLALKQNEEKDLKLKYTTIGPHRDDLKIILNGLDVKNYGSQGQQRTVALSLKLAELEIFKEILNEEPILLLDDVFSELDSFRKERLLNRVKNIQTIITATEFNENIEANIIKIENAKVVKN